MQSECLPSLREGATTAGREPPPVVANVLICPSTDREAVSSATREQFNNYTRHPLYAALFAAAGLDTSDGLPDMLIDDLVVWGDQATLIDGLRARLASPVVGELRVIPVLVGDDPESCRQLTVQMVARANEPHIRSSALPVARVPPSTEST
jgi:hypothetical protein